MSYPETAEIIVLDYPITVGGAEVTQIKMRRPKVRDRLLHDKDKGTEVERELNMMARLCNMDPDDMYDLDADDYEKVQAQFTAFRSRSQSGNSNED